MPVYLYVEIWSFHRGPFSVLATAIGHRPSAIGHQPLAMGHQPLAIGHRASAILISLQKGLYVIHFLANTICIVRIIIIIIIVVTAIVSHLSCAPLRCLKALIIHPNVCLLDYKLWSSTSSSSSPQSFSTYLALLCAVWRHYSFIQTHLYTVRN